MSTQINNNTQRTPTQRRRKRGFVIPTTKRQCQTCLNRLSLKCFSCMFFIADHAMYLLGPILIVLASVIILGLSYLFFCIVLPMLTGTNWIVTMDDYHAYQNGGGSLSQLSSAIADELQSNTNTNVQQNDENATLLSILQFILIAITTPTGMLHTTIVAFFLINIIYNYYKCVTTSNSGQVYNAVVRELATATNFNYPESEEELLHCKRELERKIAAKLECRRRELLAASSSSSTTTNNASSTPKLPKIHNWQLLTPTEWSYCRYSKQPKPPRSHYDHVTKSLVLNMDHYCPWMFNCVGYFNYRYFCNFLWFTVLGLWYGAVICCRPFLYLGGVEYREQVRASNSGSSSSGGAGSVTRAMLRGMSGRTVRHFKSNSYIPTPNERTPIALGFMVCACLGCAVGCLLAFHVYLTVTAQTTIDFHGNWAKRKKKRGWTNPYSAGSWKRNWEMVYGTRYHFRSRNDSVDDEDGDDDGIYHRSDRYSYRGCWGMFMAMMPSKREPEFLPFPIDGVLIRRTNRDYSSSMPLDAKDEEVPEELENGEDDDVTAVFKRRKSPSRIDTEKMIPSNNSNGLTARVGRNSQRGEEDMIV